LIVSCKTTKDGKSNITGPESLGKEWTLEVTPNGLDNVGVVFAIDSNGVVTRITRWQPFSCYYFITC
jgi:hypothetical protein